MLEVKWVACAGKHADVVASEAVWVICRGTFVWHTQMVSRRFEFLRSYTLLSLVFIGGHPLLASGPHTLPQLYTSLLCRGVAGTFDMEMLEGP